jgi:hypothetical protein
LEEELEAARKEPRRFRDVQTKLDAKIAECEELQSNLAALELDKSISISVARIEFEQKYKTEIKQLAAQLDLAKDNHAIESAAFEKHRRETQDMVHEDSAVPSQIDYLRRANEIRALLIRSLEDHVSSAGTALIREATRRLKIAQHSANLQSSRTRSPSQAPGRPARTGLRSQSQDRDRARERTSRPTSAARPARSATPTGRMLPWRPPSAHASSATGTAALSRSITPGRRTPQSSSSATSPRHSDAGSAAGSDREGAKFDFGCEAAAGFEMLVLQLREARRRAADLEAQLAQERAAREPLVSHIAAIEVAAAAAVPRRPVCRVRELPVDAISGGLEAKAAATAPDRRWRAGLHAGTELSISTAETVAAARVSTTPESSSGACISLDVSGAAMADSPVSPSVQAGYVTRRPPPPPPPLVLESDGASENSCGAAGKGAAEGSAAAAEGKPFEKEGEAHSPTTFAAAAAAAAAMCTEPLPLAASHTPSPTGEGVCLGAGLDGGGWGWGQDGDDMARWVSAALDEALQATQAQLRLFHREHHAGSPTAEYQTEAIATASCRAGLAESWGEVEDNGNLADAGCEGLPASNREQAKCAGIFGHECDEPCAGID